MNRNDYYPDNNWINIIEGKHQIGVSAEIVETAYSEIDYPEIKKSYLYNSFPGHEIHLNSFNISTFLITVKEFELFINETNYKTEAEIDEWGWVWEEKWTKKHGVSWRNPFLSNADEIYYENRDIMPVVMVSWNDAVEYCKWRSKENKRVRLPSEAEWEVFSCSINVSTMQNITNRDYRHIPDDPLNQINDIISEIKKTDNMFYPGIIWEWTSDWFTKYPGGIENKEYGDTYKILRGGSIYSKPVQKTREYRFRRCPTARSPFYGFRIIYES